MPHVPAPKPPNEVIRLEALHSAAVLDTAPEQAFDDITLLASTICEVPIALVSLVDVERQWFKACIGLNVSETEREVAFCAHAILRPEEILEVPDTLEDSRFADSPLVNGAPYIRFYAGAPIVMSNGLALGTVCVIDTKPRSLSPRQRDALKVLARQTAALLQLRDERDLSEKHSAELRAKITQALADDSAEHEKLRRDMRSSSINNLVSGIAHDFNNLLHAVMSNLQLIRMRAQFPQEVSAWAEKGIASVDRGGRLISRLMMHSRGESSVGSLNVPEFIAEMREMLTHVLGSQVPVTFDLRGDCATIVCDPTQLEAAVLNLVVNARDAMDGKGRVHISTAEAQITDEPDLEAGRYLRLEVSDEGPGMPREVMDKAFDPFFTTKERGKGTGLGLAQVYGFALRANGIARITKSDATGTTVTLWLKIDAG